ncbi:hypothetical protein A2630_01815 [Candidatus Woesebacteria bacterium RIFCSPHIGHO2_01_FULL_44_10]|uniref:DDH domain-containing protein n=1 Tax=Candidatus Woesebacteria bacterium RIFCSPLOWO2_01_FULL_44_14 TaxID=1802525 RepID=A0A1F8C2Y5_9BACT|nr:MAG: hypothetical protein A2630_01815 [Candidatus Woesebacteria bacterium RIFCSPHIGHO2_01_FULL_44_10]OGM54007.1 MAG: hypothetical protein A3F62_00365 [Candidatus Woesebacteria bacterium RIFCSPHIGHO2_12_FULL_44_11]OGM69975.1 MAG: hypothetical protein A2975_05205 [Candidatus Woesebacteria bacterium RIFCSPLOWO2_01_FULL_44_14]
MNYSQSKEILEKVKKARKILINCHRGPDSDSIGSALALYQVLEKMGKEVELICPSEIPAAVKFMPGIEKIRAEVDFAKFNFSKFDLFFTLDSSNWDMVAGDKNISQPTIPIIVIDHHKTNTKYGEINLVDENVTSVGELLYYVLEDWGAELNKEIATALLVGIVGDTGAFRFPGTGWPTLNVAGKLMKLGADKDEVVFNIYHSSSLELLKFWGEILKVMEIDEIGKFAWSAIPHEKFVELGSIKDAKETAATTFAQIVDTTEFGFIAVEDEKNSLTISFRSRTGFDTSQIALALGGGGHVYASGARITGLPFDQAVEKVLETCRKFAKQNV